MSRAPKTLNLLAVSLLLGAGMLATACPAAAHVRVDEGRQPPQGGYGIVTLIVPTESAAASTVGVSVTLPDGVDLTSARTLPIPGWTAAVETDPADDGDRVSRIIWRATEPANGLKPTEFGEFTFSAGPWPVDVDTVALLSDQTYSDGSVVAWNEIAVDKDSEPEHPAPVVTLAAAEDGHGHGDGHGADSDQIVNTAAAVHSDESWFWRATSLISLVIALGTAAALTVVLRRTRGPDS